MRAYELNKEGEATLRRLQVRTEAKTPAQVIDTALAILTLLSDLGDEGFTDVVATNPTTGDARRINFLGRV